MQKPRPDFSLSFLQPEHIEQSLAIICNYAGKPDGDFWSAISTLQHTSFKAASAGCEVSPVWYEGPADPIADTLSSLMGGVKSRKVAMSYAASTREPIELAFRKTLETLSLKFPATSTSFHKVIRHLVFARRDGHAGGSVSHHIGLIWLAPEPEWTEELWLEKVIHEFVHNAIFIEDMVHRVLVAGADRLGQPDAQVTSAIRQVKRGYDKAYHSALVSFTLVEMYLALGRPNLAKPFLAPLVICLDDLVDQRQFATQHGQGILLELAKAVLPIYQQSSKPQPTA